ncbi:MAG: methyltransferase domain-containing protein [Planctomycetota bacterium]
MRESLLEFLVCPSCHAALRLQADETRGEHIETGTLTCTGDGCGQRYPIVRSVPRMTGEAVEAFEVRRTASGFGWQWQTFTELESSEREREQYFDWMQPIAADDLRDKVVLDCGCGMGRWPEIAASCGARAVIGVDLSDAVEAAAARLRDVPNAHVVQANILRIPLRTGADAQVDVSYSIGVYHHMPDPKAGFLAATRHVKVGGLSHAWLYGAEGNFLIRYVVTPVRWAITSRLPRWLLYWLTLPLAGFLHVWSRVVRIAGVRRWVPLGEYMVWLSRFTFRHTHHVVFDHLVTPLAFYLPKREVEAWAAAVPTSAVWITSRNGNSWRLVIRLAGGS